MTARSLAVVGGGWAGLAAAVRAVEAGSAVTLYEMAALPGGRARTVERGADVLDNGQHILIGAYLRTLALMRTVGADPDALFHRMPLTLVDPGGRGLRLPPGPPLVAFTRGVLAREGWSLTDRARLLAAAAGWALRGFRCDPSLSVQTLCRRLPPAIRATLIDPLCVAALNTPAAEASAAVFLRVLHDALFSGPGSADLLLPRRPLSDLLPTPAWAWLAGRGATLRQGARVRTVAADGARWLVDGERHDAVVIACPAAEAARLAHAVAPAWAARAAALRYEPIVTVYVRCSGARLAAPMLTLDATAQAPAQFAFDLGALGGRDHLFAFVVSGARPWIGQGLAATEAAILRQAARWLPDATPVRTLAEKRATFRCTPDLQRPPMMIAPGLAAAGDYVEGPYPATLEGAVRAGEAAARSLSD